MADALTPYNLFLSLTGGILPAVFWLWFWLREDKLHPEPRNSIMICFTAGMLSVIPALVIEKFIGSIFSTSLFVLAAWAATEEIAKYLAAHLTILKSKSYDEPIDAMIYMITVAIGFSTVENILFLLGSENIYENLMTGGMRFIGASLLHILASSIVGGALSLSFYKKLKVKTEYLVVGLITASTLHTLFNVFIIKDDGQNLLSVFTVLWTVIIFLILFFEKVKHIKPDKKYLI